MRHGGKDHFLIHSRDVSRRNVLPAQINGLYSNILGFALQVRQGGRGVRAAYKDLRSKLRDKQGDGNEYEDGGHMSRHHNRHHFDPADMAHGGGGHNTTYSAPNSPVFSKKHVSHHPKTHEPNKSHHNHNHDTNYQQHYRLSMQNMPTQIVSATPTNPPSLTSAPINQNNHIAKSATPTSGASQSSSNSSSEMNLLQELQQHALFRTAVYRSVSPPNNKIVQTHCFALPLFSPNISPSMRSSHGPSDPGRVQWVLPHLVFVATAAALIVYAFSFEFRFVFVRFDVYVYFVRRRGICFSFLVVRDFGYDLFPLYPNHRF